MFELSQWRNRLEAACQYVAIRAVQAKVDWLYYAHPENSQAAAMICQDRAPRAFTTYACSASLAAAAQLAPYKALKLLCLGESSGASRPSPLLFPSLSIVSSSSLLHLKGPFTLNLQLWYSLKIQDYFASISNAPPRRRRRRQAVKKLVETKEQSCLAMLMLVVLQERNGGTRAR